MLSLHGQLEALNDPARFTEIARMHRAAFNWIPQGRIPLGIHVVNPDLAGDLSYADWLEPEPFLEFQRRVLIDTLSVGSDLLPVVAINHLGEATLTSMFGAEQYMPADTSATLQDVGPTPLPVFSSIEEVDTLSMPGMQDGIVPQVRAFVAYYRRHLPDWVTPVAPMPTGPFSAAMALRGSEFLLDLTRDPVRCARLIETCATVQARLEFHLREAAGTSLQEHVTNFGVLGAGLRLGDDSVVNISPRMIAEFCLPVCRLVNKLCGGRGHIHFCSLPHSRHEHVYEALLDATEVAVVSSQFGFEYYKDHLDELRHRLAVESFYGDAYSYVRETYGSFRSWALEFVPRFKNASGLVLYCQVDSIEEGREIWSIWQEAHRK